MATRAAEARLIIVAVDDASKAVEIVDTARKHFPHVRLLVRSVSWSDTYDILERGIDDVYRETFDTAIRMGSGALCALGFRRFFSQRAANRFRRHDEHFVRELAPMRHDEKQLVTQARRGLADLESVMKRENEQSGEIHDDGWDASSLIREFNDRNAE